MILEVSRGHIRVEIERWMATAQGEMFFLAKAEMGFVLYRSTLKFWDPPNHNQLIIAEDIDMIISEIRKEFVSGGHTFEVEC